MSGLELRDPIHGFIYREPLEQRVIDTSVFQRLRRLRQLAMESLVYPGADPNYFVLSIAAKADFILGKRRKAMTRIEIIREAEKFHWDIQEGSLKGAVDFLEKLGMVHTAEKAS